MYYNHKRELSELDPPKWKRCRPGCYLFLLLLPLTLWSRVKQTQTVSWCEKEVYVPTPGALCLLNDKANIMHGCVPCCRCYRVRQVISPHSAYAIERRYTIFTYMSSCGLLLTHFISVRHDQSFFLLVFISHSFFRLFSSYVSHSFSFTVSDFSPFYFITVFPNSNFCFQLFLLFIPPPPPTALHYSYFCITFFCEFLWL
jgi:hypothetical protein